MENQSIEELKLSARSITGLKRANLTTVKQIMQYPYQNILRLRLLGTKSVIEVWNKLHEIGAITKQELDKTIKDVYGIPVQRVITTYVRDGD